jgi:hypothetical protein
MEVFRHNVNSVAYSRQANYTDWATATCRRNLVPTFVDRGVSRDQRCGSPTVVNLSFLDQSRYFSFKLLLIYPHTRWLDPVPDPLLLRKSGSAGNRIQDPWVCSQELWLDHRGGPRRNLASTIIYSFFIFGQWKIFLSVLSVSWSYRRSLWPFTVLLPLPSVSEKSSLSPVTY